MIGSAVIVGAGVGGLSAAAFLARRGVRVRVFEQASQLGEVGAGVQLSPNAMKALAALGIDGAARRVGFEPEFASMRHYRTGRRYMRAPLKGACERRYGAPYIHIHRADLHRLLVEAADHAGVELNLGRQAAGFEQDAAGVSLLLSDGGQAEADLLIGADGVRSAIRARMLGPEQPRFTGQTAWRGVLPREALPPGLVAPDATVWIGPASHVVTYYLRGGALVNFVAVQERAAWREESWTQRGDPAELRAAFGDWRDEVVALIEGVEETHLWALFDRPELPRWSEGRVALLGDACHPTLPFMAQGAAMAIEDACVVSALLERSSSLSDALRRYEAHRKPRTSMLQAKARANAALFHIGAGAPELVSQLKRNLASLLPGATALAPLDAVYGYDPTVVT